MAVALALAAALMGRGRGPSGGYHPNADPVSWRRAPIDEELRHGEILGLGDLAPLIMATRDRLKQAGMAEKVRAEFKSYNENYDVRDDSANRSRYVIRKGSRLEVDEYGEVVGPGEGVQGLAHAVMQIYKHLEPLHEGRRGGGVGQAYVDGRPVACRDLVDAAIEVVRTIVRDEHLHRGLIVVPPRLWIRNLQSSCGLTIQINGGYGCCSDEEECPCEGDCADDCGCSCSEK